MNLKEAFKILELDSSNLTLKKLKHKYHKMALKWHPDKNGNTEESTERFKRIKEAYDIVSAELKDDNMHVEPGSNDDSPDTDTDTDN
jgi:DnaJ-class molecular chaperone